VPKQESPVQPAWQRWNDYGIGCLLEGGAGSKKGNLRQAEAAFQKLLTLGVKDADWQGHANLARVYLDLGRLNEAAKEVVASGTCDPPAPWWLRVWLSGLVAAENATTKAEWDEAANQFAKIVDPENQPIERNMDFTKDYVVLARLGQTYYRRAQLESFGSATRREFLDRSIAAFDRALAVDPEDLTSHYGLSQCYAEIGAGAPDKQEPVAGTAQEIADLVAAIAAGSPGRASTAVRLADAVTALGRNAPSSSSPRLKPFQAARKTLTDVYRTESDPDTKTALAFALSCLHRELHALFKPDELARSAATKAYRETHPAANAAAEAIVHYPTDRFGKK
jgi:tetratricopeptide (TPR) repeat protein